MANRPNYNNAIKFSEMSDKDGNIIGSLGTVYLTGGGFINEPFEGIGPDSQFGWDEMVWYKSPTRTQDFSLKGIDESNYKVGLVPRCEINIKYMNIEQFMKLRKIVARERHFLARFFNVDSGMWETRDMYCTESSRNQLFTLKQSLVGVVDVAIKLVGTNLDRDTSTKTISFNVNGGTGSINSLIIQIGDQVKLPTIADSGISAPSGKSFAYWVTMNESDVTGYYTEGQSITVWTDLALYAQWQ